MKRRIVFVFISSIFVFFSVCVSAKAETLSSQNFRVYDATINATGGGRATSTSFTLQGSLGQLAAGTSTATSFRINAGLLSYPTTTIPRVTDTSAADGKVGLSWTFARGSLGWTVSGYTVGQSTSSGGPYIYTSIGSTTSKVVSGLTNGTTYYFVVLPENAFGNTIATSSEVSVAPAAATAISIQSEEMSTVVASSTTFVDANTTQLSLDVPANALSSAVTLNRKIASAPESTVTATRVLPSGKSASNTMFEVAFTSSIDGSAVTSLDQAVTLTLTYRDADVSDIDESTLAAYRWNGSSWGALSGSSVNTANNTVSVTSKDFSFFALLGNVPSAASSGGGVVSVPTVTSSGSGGRETIGPWLTSVVFNGTAYPGSMVTILKNAQLAAMRRVSSNGRFTISLPSISVGTHTFGIWAEDTAGYRSITHTFTVTVKYGESVSISGIVLPPTISTDKKEVRIDDAVTIFGIAAPGAQVLLYAGNNHDALAEIQADTDGTWRHKLSARLLGDGEHTIRARALFGGSRSTFSQAATLSVGLKNIIRPEPREVPAHSDFNGDKKVNLVDFSIAAYWYKKEKPPTRVDPNRDGTVDIRDFSILAYYWTG